MKKLYYKTECNLLREIKNISLRMPKFKVQSGKLNKTVRAKNYKKAALKAVELYNVDLGMLIAVTKVDEKTLTDGWFFNTESILDELNIEIIKK